MWNDAGCNCDGVRSVLTHDATFEHYARVAAKFEAQCDVTPRTNCENQLLEVRRYGVIHHDGFDASSGHFHLALPERDAIGIRTGAAMIPELPGNRRSLKSAWESTAGKQTIECDKMQSAILALLPCLGQVPASESDECCKGLNSWNDAGCYCDGVQTVMEIRRRQRRTSSWPPSSTRVWGGKSDGFKPPSVRAPTPRAAADAAAAQPAAATPASSTRVRDDRCAGDLGGVLPILLAVRVGRADG